MGVSDIGANLRNHFGSTHQRTACRGCIIGAGDRAAAPHYAVMLRLICEMPAKDKVVNIAFSVCAAFMLGDHLAFTANFQPNLILPVILGKLSGGIFAIVLAFWLSVPKAIELEKGDAPPQESAGDSRD